MPGFLKVEELSTWLTKAGLGGQGDWISEKSRNLKGVETGFGLLAS